MKKFLSVVLTPQTILAIIYSLSPIDFIPDVVPIAGSADDTVVMLVGIIWAAINANKKEKGELR